EVVQQQRNLSHQREFYLQAYFVHERAERAAARASSRLPIPPTLSPTAGSALVLDAPTQTAPSSIRGALPLEMVSPEPDAGAHSVGTVVAEPVAPSEAAERPPTTSTLTAHLLGGFRVAVNDSPVESWPKGKGRALLKYLLTHRHRPTPRDVLMEVLWPEADPEAARNRLNVALHGLRRALRSAADVPVIVFEDGAYRLDAGLRLWLDVDEFERHIRSGRQLEAAGKRAAAAAEYEVAIGLYQGDFLADDPYESWPVQQRERLRVDYLEALDRLSQIYFDKSQYASCVALCHLILARDNCREDAHCRLMRCYSRQGQPHLALRQYEACLGALRAELEVNPAPATTQLYERIRRRERV
ncbi:MAG: AfsR/SARP family transcriptional regulator, partial [Anaerolineales bacterium]